MTTNAPIVESLDICAEQAGDITDAIYARFFETCDGAHRLMGHSDEYMRSRMLEQVFELLMDDTHLGESGYLRWEVNNHLAAYGVNAEMYITFFHAVRDVVQASIGEGWNAAHEAAWQARIDTLLQDVDAEAAVMSL